MSADKDLEKRIADFNTELKKLLGKHNLGLAAEPVIMSDGRLAARPLLVDANQAKEKK